MESIDQSPLVDRFLQELQQLASIAHLLATLYTTGLVQLLLASTRRQEDLSYNRKKRVPKPSFDTLSIYYIL